MGGAAALLGTEVLGTFLNISNAQAGESAQEAALRLQQTEQRTAAANQTSQRVSQAEKILGQQSVQGAARGLNAAGTSMKAMTLNTMDAFSQDEHAAALNLSFQNANTQENMALARMRAEGQEFGALGALGTQLAQGSYYGSSEAYNGQGIFGNAYNETSNFFRGL